MKKESPSHPGMRSQARISSFNGSKNQCTWAFDGVWELECVVLSDLGEKWSRAFDWAAETFCALLKRRNVVGQMLAR